MKADRQIVHRPQTNWLQRSAACWLCLGWHLSTDEKLRRWTIHNVRVGAWLLTPAVFVLPTIGFIFWQVTSWWDMLTDMLGHVIGLLIFLLIMLIVVRNITAFPKR